jgi:hypothetical protein
MPGVPTRAYKCGMCTLGNSWDRSLVVSASELTGHIGSLGSTHQAVQPPSTVSVPILELPLPHSDACLLPRTCCCCCIPPLEPLLQLLLLGRSTRLFDCC